MKKFISLCLTICLLLFHSYFEAEEVQNPDNKVPEKTNQHIITKKEMALDILKILIEAQKFVLVNAVNPIALCPVCKKIFLLEIYGILRLLGMISRGAGRSDMTGDLNNEIWYRTTAKRYDVCGVDQQISTSELRNICQNVTELLNNNYTIYFPIMFLQGGNSALAHEDTLLISDSQNNFFEIHKNPSQQMVPIQLDRAKDYNSYGGAVTHMLKINRSLNLNSETLHFNQNDLISLYDD